MTERPNSRMRGSSLQLHCLCLGTRCRPCVRASEQPAVRTLGLPCLGEGFEGNGYSSVTRSEGVPCKCCDMRTSTKDMKHPTRHRPVWRRLHLSPHLAPHLHRDGLPGRQTAGRLSSGWRRPTRLGPPATPTRDWTGDNFWHSAGLGLVDSCGHIGSRVRQVLIGASGDGLQRHVAH